MSLWCDDPRGIDVNSPNCKHYIINNDKSSLTWPDISVGWSVKDTKKNVKQMLYATVQYKNIK